jgi:hypothetical protein
MVVLIKCGFRIIDMYLFTCNDLDTDTLDSCYRAFEAIVVYLAIAEDLEDLAEATAAYPFEDLIRRFIALYQPRALRHAD